MVSLMSLKLTECFVVLNSTLTDIVQANEMNSFSGNTPCIKNPFSFYIIIINYNTQKDRVNDSSLALTDIA